MPCQSTLSNIRYLPPAAIPEQQPPLTGARPPFPILTQCRTVVITESVFELTAFMRMKHTDLAGPRAAQDQLVLYMPFNCVH